MGGFLLSAQKYIIAVSSQLTILYNHTTSFSYQFYVFYHVVASLPRLYCLGRSATFRGPDCRRIFAAREVALWIPRVVSQQWFQALVCE